MRIGLAQLPAGDGTELDDLKLDGPKLSSALLELPGGLSWSAHRGELDPSSVGTPQASGGSSRRP